MLLRILILSLLSVFAAIPADAQPPIVVTVGVGCSPACTYTTVGAAITAVSAARSSVCAEYFIDVTAGQTFTESYDIPGDLGGCRKFITIQTNLYPNLPVNTRVGLADTVNMPTLVNGGGGYFIRCGSLATGACTYYRFRGLYFLPSPSAVNFNQLYIGEHSSQLVYLQSQLPDYIYVDQCVFGNQTTLRSFTRNIIFNTKHGEISNSYMDGAYDTEPQTIAACTARNVTIRNNYLRSPGENVLFGGCGSTGFSGIAIAGYRESNLQVLGNYTPWKPQWYKIKFNGLPGIWPNLTNCYPGSSYQNLTGGQWYECQPDGVTWTAVSAPDFAGLTFGTKNHLEWKDGNGIVARGNIGTEGWKDGQNGQCFFLNAFPTLGVIDYTYEYNYCIGSIQMVSLSGGPSYFGKVRHNIAHNMVRPGNVNTDDVTPSLIGPSSTAIFKFGLASGDGTFANNSVSTDNLTAAPATYVNLPDAVTWAEPPYNPPAAPIQLDNIYGNYNLTANIIAGVNIWTILRSSEPDFSWCNLIDYAATGTGVQYDYQVAAVSTYFAGGTTTGTCSPRTVWPTGTITRSANTAVFVDPQAGDMTLVTSGSPPWIASGPDGKNLGANKPATDLMTSQVITGAYNPALDWRVQVRRSGTTGRVDVSGIAPAGSAACAVTASTARNFASTTGTPTLTVTGRNMTGNVTGLTVGATVWVRVECNISGGSIYEDTPVAVL